VEEIAQNHRYPFSRRVILINNVDDREGAQNMAQTLCDTGIITEFHFVSDLLESTLRAAELTREDIEPNIHYTDCSLVAMFLPGSEFVLYCDADVRLQSPHDWISPSLHLMEQDERVAVANPNWPQPTLAAEAREFIGEFGLGYGFSDQLYLVRRSEFAQPIYKFSVPISMRYPLSAHGRVFEQMIDSYMRVHERLRATCTCASYTHGGDEGASYPEMAGLARWKRIRNQLVLRLLRLFPGRHPHFKQ
jgi:hypothetical protein